MQIPTIRGTIDRRILVNFRIDSEALARIVPQPFRPQLVAGYGIAGICLIRLKQVRPQFLPSLAGLSSENAAHRIAIEWDADGERKTGVFIPRRDTSSWLNVLAGGRVFPGVHHRATFDVDETDDCYRVAMESRDRSTSIHVEGKVAANLSSDSVFGSIDEASDFFEAGSIGYSPDVSRDRFDGLELRSFNWKVAPIAVDHVASSFFADEEVFPPGSVTFDSALLMRDIAHEWHGREPLCCASLATAAAFQTRSG